jgi:hypothetical protein
MRTGPAGDNASRSTLCQEQTLMTSIVKVTGVRWLEAYRLHVKFSDGTAGAHDFSEMVQLSGPMIEPLGDVPLFKQAFIRLGGITWPNGFDIDAVRLHSEMKDAGELHREAAE